MSKVEPIACPIDAWLKMSRKRPQDLARLSGVHSSSISFFRSRKRRLRQPSIQALADAMGIRAEALSLWQDGYDPRPFLTTSTAERPLGVEAGRKGAA